MIESGDRARLALADIDLPMLATYVDSRDYRAAYLDPATGELYPSFDDEVLGNDGERVDLETVDWIGVGGAGSHEAYRDMEDFAATVSDRALARRLDSALGGRGAFRRFRDEVYAAPEEVSHAWNAFRDARAEARALDWLRAHQLVDDAEADAEAEALRTRASAALDPVRGHGAHARLIILNGLPGMGKSTLAARWAADHAGTLCLDPDRLRPMISGEVTATAEPARVLALAMAAAHLATGRDVVLPQLLARADQVERFTAAADEVGAAVVEVVLVDAGNDPAGRLARLPEDPVASGVRRPLAEPGGRERFEAYARGLEKVTGRPGAHRLPTTEGEVDAAYADLARLLNGLRGRLTPSAGARRGKDP